MSESPDLRHYYINFSEKLAFNLFRFEGSDWTVLILCFGGCLGLGRAWGSLAAFGGFLVMLGVMFRWMDGRTYYLVFRKTHDVYIRKLKKGVITAPKFRKDGTLAKTWRAIAIHLQPIPLSDGDKLDYGILHNTASKQYTMFLVGSGSPFSSEEPGQQFFDIDLMNQGATRAQATYSDGSIGFSTLFSVRPPDVNELIHEFDGHAWSGTFSPIGLETPYEELTPAEKADLWTFHNMHGQIAMAGASTSKITEAFAVTMPEEADLKNAAEKGIAITKAALESLPLVKATRTYKNAIRATGALDLHEATFAELVGILRGGWDVADIEQFYDTADLKLASMLPVTNDGEVKDESDTETGVAVDEPVMTTDELAQFIWPTYIRVTKNMIQTENTYHTVLRLTTSQELLMPEFQLQLHRSCNTNDLRDGIPYFTISQVGVSRGAITAYAMTGWLISMLDIFRNWYGAGRTGPIARKRTQSLENRQEVQAENRVLMHYDYLIHVAARSEVELERDVSVINTTCETLGFTPRRVTGESWQLRMLLEAITCNDNK